MYAIVEISGEQYRLEPSMKIRVPRIAKEAGAAVTFDHVLLHAGADVRIGFPYIEGASVTATVVSHGRDEKVIVFKKKRRKGYKVKRGHRQHFTTIEVNSITA
jgi:large subunit ribosomal protein L21